MIPTNIKKKVFLVTIFFSFLIFAILILEKKKLLTSFFFVKSNPSCFKKKSDFKKDKLNHYDIILAGHTYGSPGVQEKGTYKKFLVY